MRCMPLTAASTDLCFYTLNRLNFAKLGEQFEGETLNSWANILKESLTLIFLSITITGNPVFPDSKLTIK